MADKATVRVVDVAVTGFACGCDPAAGVECRLHLTMITDGSRRPMALLAEARLIQAQLRTLLPPDQPVTVEQLAEATALIDRHDEIRWQLTDLERGYPATRVEQLARQGYRSEAERVEDRREQRLTALTWRGRLARLWARHGDGWLALGAVGVLIGIGLVVYMLVVA